MYAHHTYLLALLREVVNGLVSSLSGRTHEDDNTLCVLCTVVVEKVVLTACYLGQLLQIVLHHLRHLIVSGVASLTMSEECLGVLCRTACHRMLRSKSTVTEALDILRIHEFGHILLIYHLYLVVLMRSTESVEEVDERDVSLERGKMRSSRKVHHFLHRA